MGRICLEEKQGNASFSTTLLLTSGKRIAIICMLHLIHRSLTLTIPHFALPQRSYPSHPHAGGGVRLTTLSGFRGREGVYDVNYWDINLSHCT